MSEPSTPMAFKAKPELARRLERLATQRGEPVSQLIPMLLHEALRAHEQIEEGRRRLAAFRKRIESGDPPTFLQQAIALVEEAEASVRLDGDTQSGEPT